MNEKQIYENLDSSIKLLNENVSLKKQLESIKFNLNKIKVVLQEYKQGSHDVENEWAEEICDEILKMIEKGK